MQIRRIVVAMDGSPTSLAGMEAASGLASMWRSEIVGLLIEDTNLLRMASLPFSREVGSHSGAFRVISPDDVEHQFHTQADRARNTLWYVAERYRLTASFSVVRGSVGQELLKAVRESDLLCIGKGGESVAGHHGLGRNASALLEQAEGNVLLFSHVASATGPLAVFYDGSAAADRALEASVEFVKAFGTPTTVLCPVESTKNMEELSTRARRQLSDTAQGVEFRQVRSHNERDLARFARSTGANMIVVPNGGDVLQSQAIRELASFFFGPVMVVGRDVGDNTASGGNGVAVKSQ